MGGLLCCCAKFVCQRWLAAVQLRCCTRHLIFSNSCHVVNSAIACRLDLAVLLQVLHVSLSRAPWWYLEVQPESIQRGSIPPCRQLTAPVFEDRQKDSRMCLCCVGTYNS